jgi:hypothetical protein
LVNDRQGYIDATGHLIIAPRFDDAGQFSEGLAWVIVGAEMVHVQGQLSPVGGKTGYIDTAGTFVIPPVYDGGMNFSEGLAAVRVGKSWGYIDKLGKIVIKPRFEVASEFHNSTAVVQQSGRTEYVDREGNFVSPPPTPPLSAKSSHMLPFSEGLAAVFDESTRMWGYVDKTGEYRIRPSFQFASSFSEGLAAASPDGGKWGYLNPAGEWTIKPQFDAAQDFSGGLAAVKIGGATGHWGYVDRTGQFAIPPHFEQAGPFVNGLANVIVRVGGWFEYWRMTYIDAAGRVVWQSSSPAE